MSVRTILLAAALLSARPALAADSASSSGENPCRSSLPTIRGLWRRDLYDASPGVTALMVDVIDGRLSEARRRLAALPGAERAGWRQLAMLTAVQAGRPGIVDALLHDGAAVDGTAWLPPFKHGFYRQTLDGMARDPRFGGPASVKELQASGILGNQGSRLGPALPMAAACGDAAVVDALLRHHADVMARAAPNVADAMTAALVRGDAPIVQRLLDHGDDPCMEDRRLRKPGVTVAGIGRRHGLPPALASRLVCPPPGQTGPG
jgi:hypothetical protein